MIEVHIQKEHEPIIFSPINFANIGPQSMPFIPEERH